MAFLKSVVLKGLSLTLLLTLVAHSFAAKNKKPNIVIILTDDQGYGDLGCYGSDKVKTPRIDQMAKEGAILSSFYVAAPVCTPSRAALMTGSYPQRVDMDYGSKFGVLLSADSKGLNPKEITIAEVAKAAGYKTGMFGKWHLGDQPDFLPTRQGFDEFFGIPYSHDIHPFHPRQYKFHFPPLPLLEGEKVIEHDPNADYLTKRITEKAVAYIKKNKKQPFLMYVAHPIPHRPLHMSPAFMEAVPKEYRDIIAEKEKANGFIDYETRDKIYPYAISEIDWSVGQILDELKKQGIDKNTIVLYTSDNGPDGPVSSSAGPLRGRKGSTYEGGMREPTVIRWPEKIKAGQENKELMTTMDILPTLASIVGYDMPDDRIIDGKNILPTLTNNAPTPHEYFFYHRKSELQAVRHKQWKLHIKKNKPIELYNLDKDIGEQVNLLKKQPEIVKQLFKAAEKFSKELKSNIRPAAFVDDPKALSMD